MPKVCVALQLFFAPDWDYKVDLSATIQIPEVYYASVVSSHVL